MLTRCSQTNHGLEPSLLRRAHAPVVVGYPGKQTLCLSGQGEKLWENRVSVYEPSLLTVNDLLFGITDGGIAYCWSVADGTERRDLKFAL